MKRITNHELRITNDKLRIRRPGFFIRHSSFVIRHSEGGFTLLEMLIAVTLVAMMAVGLWAVFRISVQSWSRGTEFIDSNQRHRSILDMIRKQIASTYGLFVAPDPKTGGNPLLIFSGSETQIRFISLNSLQFQKSPGLTLVSYDVEQGLKGDYELVEREERYLGQRPDLTTQPAQTMPIKIFENLLSCIFEYYDPGTNDIPAQWVREWDGEKEGKLPVAVSMTMVSRDRQGNNLSRHMVVPIQAKVYDIRLNFANPRIVTPGVVSPPGTVIR
jgi:prepilin-type N-terminal cleavage/methylation domain-containing protein